MGRSWLQQLVDQLRRSRPRGSRQGRTASPRFRPAVEALEDRLAPATLTVTSTADAGGGSLRQAILDANNNTGPDRIEFNIGGGGAQTISPVTSLPAAFLGALVIDATTQPGYAGVPLIQLDGGNRAGLGHGLDIGFGSSGSAVRGLIIMRFPASGIHIDNDVANVTIQGCYIGTNAAGDTGLGNGGSGINGPFCGPNIVLGGDGPGEGNVLASNSIYGFDLGGGSSRLMGNFIGTNPSGTAALPNRTGGGALDGNNNTVGGTTPGARNVISGNIGPGFYSYGANNVIQGNTIGTNAAGTAALANTNDGIHLAGGNAVTIIGNLISGNGGIGIAAFNSANNIIQGNLVGTNAAGTARIGNGSSGILLNNDHNLVGGTTPAVRNVISGNGGPGVELTAGGADNTNTIQGNYIGTDVTGTIAFPNNSGISVDGSNHLIADNLISGNSGAGVSFVTFGSGIGTRLVGNRIGTDVTGTGPLPNTGNGLSIGASNNTIGGTAAGEGNIIAFNGADGIFVSSGTGNAIRQNSIFSNGGLGIDINPGGVNPNDVGDVDTGANNKQNYPVLNTVSVAGGTTTVAGTLNSIANATFTIEFFSSPAGDATGFGEGAVYLGSTPVTTDASGNAGFSVPLMGAVAAGHAISATATDAANNTSEFSGNLTIGVAFLQLNAATYSISENGGSLTVTVLRGGDVNTAVSVNYATSGGNATAGQDYTAATSTVSFAAGQTTASFTIPILDDAIFEPNETFNVTLSSPTGGAILRTPNTAVVTIVENDPPMPGSLQFSAAAYSVGEGTSSITITVTRTNGTDLAVSVMYATSEGTATAAADYTARSGSLNFAQGATSATFSVPILNDTLVEGNETVILTLANPTNGAVLGTPNPAVLTIVDNEVAVPGTFQFSAATYSVNENAGSAVITVTRSAGNNIPAAVSVATANGTAIAGADYTATSGTLLFAAGQTSATFTVPILDDLLAEGPETVNLALAGPTNGATLGSPNTAVLTIVDDEPNQPPSIAAVANQSTPEENPKSLVVTVNDPDTPADQLVVTGTSSNPVLLPNANILIGPGGSATQRSVTLTPALDQTGSTTITLTVTDNTFGTASTTFVLTVTPVNDPPVLAVNTRLTASAGEQTVLGPGQLLTTDVDNTPAQLSYTLTTLPANGALQRNGNPLALSGTFTQQDINDGVIRYVHNGSATVADSFGFTVTDGGGRTTTLASRDSGGAFGNNQSAQASISANGRYVVFRSTASNLVPDDTNNVADVFLNDRLTGQTTRVSLDDGGVQGNAASAASAFNSVAVSADGRYVAFTSSATNLVAGDTNGFPDVFLRDRQLGTTTRVSVGPGGVEANNASALNGGLAMTPDGRYIVYGSPATNLVSGGTSSTDHIFVWDRLTGLNTQVSLSSTGVQSNNRSDDVSISADGRYVAFRSLGSNLVSGDTNNAQDIFVRDLQTGQTTRVSVSSTGTQTTVSSSRPSISADGRYVAFESSASNLVTGDTNTASDIFVRDLQTPQTTRVSLGPGGVQANGSSQTPSLSADGRFVAFGSSATNFVTGDTNLSDIFLYDRQTGQIVQMSVSTSGAAGNAASIAPSLAANGQTVAFESTATNLVPVSTTSRQVFVGDTGIIPGTTPITITPASLRVALTPTRTGFVAVFNRALDLSVLNLYDTEAGPSPADATLTGTTTGPVRGSLVVDAAAGRATFVATGGPLAPDTYNVVLRSTASGFRDTAFNQLDGNADGTPGDNFTATFMAASSQVVVSVPDFARGPGQPVGVPASLTGLPLRLSSGGVTAVELNLLYESDLLSVSGFSRGAGLPVDAVLSVDLTTIGRVRVTISSPTALPAGTIELVRLLAAVPDTAPYAAKQVLDISDLRVNGGALAAQDDDGVHVAAYLGDASGNARYSSIDAARALRVAVGLDRGFLAFPLADPVVIADVTADGRLSSLDATRILQEVVGIDQASIPPLPANPPVVPVTGPDPLLNIPKTLKGRPGDTITVPVNLDVSEGLNAVDLALAYDRTRLEVLSAADIRPGTLTGDFDLFQANLDPATGTIRVGLASLRAAGLTGKGSGSVLEITFHIRSDAPAGPAVINLLNDLSPTQTQLNEGGLVLTPAPSNAAGDALDGMILVQPLPAVRRVVLEASGQRSWAARITVAFSTLVQNWLRDRRRSSA